MAAVRKGCCLVFFRIPRARAANGGAASDGTRAEKAAGEGEPMRDQGTHTYGNVSGKKVDAILDALIAHGSVVTGDNPWIVDTRKHGVLLRGDWNEEALTLAITLADSDWYVPPSAVWENIDALMRNVGEEG